VRRGKVHELEGEAERLTEEEDALDFGKELEAMDGRARAEVSSLMHMLIVYIYIYIYVFIYVYVYECVYV